MYNDGRGLAEAERIEQVAPRLSPARSAGSSLAKLLFLKDRLRPGPGTLALHQADWLLGYLTGRYGVSDWNNCLKLGLDPQTADWPRWLSRLEPAPVELPRVVAPSAARWCSRSSDGNRSPRPNTASTATGSVPTGWLAGHPTAVGWCCDVTSTKGKSNG